MEILSLERATDAAGSWSSSPTVASCDPIDVGRWTHVRSCWHRISVTSYGVIYFVSSGMDRWSHQKRRIMPVEKYILNTPYTNTMNIAIISQRLYIGQMLSLLLSSWHRSAPVSGLTVICFKMVELVEYFIAIVLLCGNCTYIVCCTIA